jgi:SepF-like predicted cell division protein (DUF552 family)
MELDEIRSLGNDFLSNIQRLQTTRAINEANQVVEELHSSDLDDAKKRQNLKQTANALAMRLAQLQTPATTIQAIFSSINPKASASIDEALMSDDPFEQAKGLNLLKKKSEAESSIESAKIGAQTERDTSLENLKFGHNKALKAMEIQGQKDVEAIKKGTAGSNPLDVKLNKLSDGGKKRFDDIILALKGARGMETALKEGNNTFEAFGSDKFTIAQGEYMEGWGRLQSQGQIGNEEKKDFKLGTPGMSDSGTMQNVKLKRIQSTLENRLKTLGFSIDEIEPLLQSTTSKITPSTTTTKGPLVFK